MNLYLLFEFTQGGLLRICLSIVFCAFLRTHLRGIFLRRRAVAEVNSNWGWLVIVRDDEALRGEGRGVGVVDILVGLEGRPAASFMVIISDCTGVSNSFFFDAAVPFPLRRIQVPRLVLSLRPNLLFGLHWLNLVIGIIVLQIIVAPRCKRRSPSGTNILPERLLAYTLKGLRDVIQLADLVVRWLIFDLQTFMLRQKVLLRLLRISKAIALALLRSKDDLLFGWSSGHHASILYNIYQCDRIRGFSIRRGWAGIRKLYQEKSSPQIEKVYQPMKDSFSSRFYSVFERFVHSVQVRPYSEGLPSFRFSRFWDLYLLGVQRRIFFQVGLLFALSQWGCLGLIKLQGERINLLNKVKELSAFLWVFIYLLMQLVIGYFSRGEETAMMPLLVKMLPRAAFFLGEDLQAAKMGNFFFLRWQTGVMVEQSERWILLGMTCARLKGCSCYWVSLYLKNLQISFPSSLLLLLILQNVKIIIGIHAIQSGSESPILIEMQTQFLHNFSIHFDLIWLNGRPG